DRIQVEVVAEHQLAAEGALGTLGRQGLPVAVARDALCTDREYVALHVEVDAFGRDAGKIELDDEALTFSPGIHRHHGRTVRRAEHLLSQTIEVTERVSGTDQHHMSS